MVLEARNGEAGMVAAHARSWYEAAILFMISLYVLLAILWLAQQACPRCSAFAKSKCA